MKVSVITQGGQVYDIDESEVGAARADGAVPATPDQVKAYDAQARSGGIGDAIRTVGETALATGVKLIDQIPGVNAGPAPAGLTELEPGQIENPLTGAVVDPLAIERRAANPTAALAGTVLAEAPTLLIPGGAGLGAAARLGLAAARAAVTGGITEAGQSVITGDEFSPTKAAFYGVVGEALSTLASGGLGRLMRTTGKEAPEALEVAARKATKADAADAIGELADSPLKAQKLADNADTLLDKSTDELAEAFSTIEKRTAKANDAMFTKANIARAVSKNTQAQADALYTQSAALDVLAADLIAEGQTGFAKTIRESATELLNARTGTQMYSAGRSVVKRLAEEAPAELSQAARETIGQLDDVLADESIWGGVAKSYGTQRTSAAGRQAFASDLFTDGVEINRPKVQQLFEQGADRTQLTAYLDAAEAAARQSSDKSLRKAVETARAALASGDDVLGAKIVTNTFGKRVADFVADKAVGQGAKYALGALGLKGGPVGAAAGYAAGEFLAPKVAKVIRGPIERALSGPTVEGTRAALSAVQRSATTQIETAGRTLTNAALRSAQSTLKNIGAPTMSVGVSRFMGDNTSLRAAYSEKRDVLDRIRDNPQLLVDELSDSLGSLSTTAPQLHAALVTKTYQVMGFIRSKMPATIGASLASPSGIPPSQLALRQFALYYSAATDPSSVVEDVKNNRVRAEQMETLRNVWPEVYTELKTSVLESMKSSKPTPQMRMRMDMLFDFGVSLDAGLSWSLAVRAQEARAAQAKATPRRGNVSARLARSRINSTQPQGLQALQNPQGMV